MCLETPILINTNVSPDLIVFNARFNSEWTDVVTGAISEVSTMISRYLVLIFSSVTCFSSCFSASSLIRVQMHLEICTFW